MSFVGRNAGLEVLLGIYGWIMYRVVRPEFRCNSRLLERICLARGRTGCICGIPNLVTIH
jgi:hypothetical protein